MKSNALETALNRILKPLITLCVKRGFSFGRFSDLSKKMFVDCGFTEMERKGQKETVSNVSILTGINRKEVKRLKEIDGNVNTPTQKLNRVVRVLAGWAHDDEFLDADGEPKDLMLEGDQGSFSDLVKKYSGDMPVVAMLNALLSSKNIIIRDNGLIQLLNHHYLPTDDTDKKLEILGVDVAELMATIEHNVSDLHNDSLWFQRKASNTQVSKKALPKLQKLTRDKALALLEDLDSHMSNNETQGDESSYVSVGVYYYEAGENPEEKTS